jgi:hypothetical protein
MFVCRQPRARSWSARAGFEEHHKRRIIALSEGPPIRILLVDDEPLIRLDVRLLLEDAGYDVIEAFSADEALRLLGEAKFDAVVTDIDMPGTIDGLGLLESSVVKCLTSLLSSYPAGCWRDARSFRSKPPSLLSRIRARCCYKGSRRHWSANCG